MKKIWLYVILISVGSFAQAKIVAPTLTQDWGTIKAEETVLKHTFVIKNSGSDTLIIYRVKPGCSCTVVSYTQKIAPQDSGFINVGLSIHPSSRKQSKTVSVYSNDPKLPHLVLHLKANPLGPINIGARFKQYYANTLIHDTLSITTPKKDLKIFDFYYEQRGVSKGAKAPLRTKDFKVKQLKRTGPDTFNYYHYTYLLTFTIPSQTRQSGSIYFSTNHPKMAKGQIRCFIDMVDTSK